MKRAVSISLGSSKRDKEVIIELKDRPISVRRIGTDGNVQKYCRLLAELDGQVDALGVGGIDLYLRLDDREYPLFAALKLVRGVRRTPLVDGRGLKHTLERRVFHLAAPMLGERLHFRRALLPVAIDRLSLAKATAEVAEELIIGDLMFALGFPIPVRSLTAFRRLARLFLPMVSYFPMRLIFYGSSGETTKCRYHRHYRDSDLIAGDFLFMKKHLPQDLTGKTIVTNTTTAENVEYLRALGVRRLITTTPRYKGRSFGTNMMEAALTAYAGKKRRLTDEELTDLIVELKLRPSIKKLNE